LRLGGVGYSFTLRNRSEFAITDTELKLIAVAARISDKVDSRTDLNGYVFSHETSLTLMESARCLLTLPHVQFWGTENSG
jgi:hypothetical protein